MWSNKRHNPTYKHWKRLKAIGEGREGKCYLVENMDTRHQAVMKTPNGQNTLPNEVAALKRLNHPNILKLIEYDLEGEYPYMITEYCENGSLNKHSFHRWPLDRKMKVINGVCKATSYLIKQGITHGPHRGNIFLKKDFTAVIGDFGSHLSTDNSPQEKLKLMQVANIRTVAYLFYAMMEGAKPMRELSWDIYDTETEQERVASMDELL